MPRALVGRLRVGSTEICLDVTTDIGVKVLLAGVGVAVAVAQAQSTVGVAVGFQLQGRRTLVSGSWGVLEVARYRVPDTDGGSCRRMRVHRL